jgi:hypothetical protein
MVVLGVFDLAGMLSYPVNYLSMTDCYSVYSLITSAKLFGIDYMNKLVWMIYLS